MEYICRGVYLVTNDSWTYDEEETMIEQDGILDFLTTEFCNRFTDFKKVREINCTLKSYDGWLIAKNESFCIGVRETGNGLLIELLQIHGGQEQDCKEYYLAINSILSQRIYN